MAMVQGTNLASAEVRASKLSISCLLRKKEKGVASVQKCKSLSLSGEADAGWRVGEIQSVLPRGSLLLPRRAARRGDPAAPPPGLRAPLRGLLSPAPLAGVPAGSTRRRGAAPIAARSAGGKRSRVQTGSPPPEPGARGGGVTARAGALTRRTRASRGWRSAAGWASPPRTPATSRRPRGREPGRRCSGGGASPLLLETPAGMLELGPPRRSARLEPPQHSLPEGEPGGPPRPRLQRPGRAAAAAANAPAWSRESGAARRRGPPGEREAGPMPPRGHALMRGEAGALLDGDGRGTTGPAPGSRRPTCSHLAANSPECVLRPRAPAK